MGRCKGPDFFYRFHGTGQRLSVSYGLQGFDSIACHGRQAGKTRLFLFLYLHFKSLALQVCVRIATRPTKSK